MLFIFLFSAFRFPTAVCIMECILPQCSKPAKEDVKPMADDRIPSVMNASFKRGDDFGTTIEYLKAKGTVLASHRSCVSSYTSHHIERYVKKRKLHEEHRAEKKSHPSEHHEFNFRSNCLFCNEPCKEADPKSPSRWRPYDVVRSCSSKQNAIQGLYSKNLCSTQRLLVKGWAVSSRIDHIWPSCCWCSLLSRLQNWISAFKLCRKTSEFFKRRNGLSLSFSDQTYEK